MRDLTQCAKDAIDEVFSNTAVFPEETLGELEDVREHLDMLIECIESDLEAADGS